ncbi:MAG: MFS transporter, partial [Chloroflexota bacterium]|nr:MFS transporter [Chloroflexota bacterium]
ALTLVAGALADRVDRRKLLLVTQSTMALNAAVLAVVTYLGVASIWIVLVAAVVQSATFAFDNPARQSMIPRIVPVSLLPSAIGLQSAAFNGASIIGPLIAGLMYIPIGIPGLLAANALSFTSIIFALLAMRPLAPAVARPSHSLLASVVEGARYTRRNPALVWILTISATVFIAAGPANALLPAVAGESVLHGVSWLSILLSAMGLGSLAGAVVVMKVGRVRSLGNVFVFAAAANGLALALFAVSSQPVVALIFVFATGLTGTVTAGMGNNMLQATTSDAYRGRVMSLWGILFIGVMPAGQLGLGMLGSLLGIHAALFLGGLVTLAAGVYGLTRVRVVREWRRSKREPQAAWERAIPEVASARVQTITLSEATTLK